MRADYDHDYHKMTADGLHHAGEILTVLLTAKPLWQ
jgi:hypothetical protein